MSFIGSSFSFILIKKRIGYYELRFKGLVGAIVEEDFYFDDFSLQRFSSVFDLCIREIRCFLGCLKRHFLAIFGCACTLGRKYGILSE